MVHEAVNFQELDRKPSLLVPNLHDYAELLQEVSGRIPTEHVALLDLAELAGCFVVDFTEVCSLGLECGPTLGEESGFLDEVVVAGGHLSPTDDIFY